MRRRWYVALVGVLLAAALGLIAGRIVPAKYEATSDVLLLPPLPKGNPTGANPYLGLAGYQPFADVVARALTDTANVEALRSQGVNDSFSVERDLSTAGPVLLIKITSSAPGQVLPELRTVLGSIPGQLARLQTAQNVPANARFTAQTITEPENPSTVRKAQIRAELVAVAGGLFLAALATSVLDAALVRRSQGARRRPLPRLDRSTRAGAKSARAANGALHDELDEWSIELADLDDAAGAGEPELVPTGAATHESDDVGPRRPLARRIGLRG